MADDTAALFPFPHQPFFELAPARMHLLGMLIAGCDPDSIDLDRLRSVKWHAAASMLADPSPTGFEGILSNAPLPMWSIEDYQTLWSLMPCPKARAVMQHADAVTQGLVSTLNELPPPLRSIRVVRHLRRPIEAKVVARLCDTDAKADLLLQMLQRLVSRQGFFQCLMQVVRKSEVFPAPPPIAHEAVTPINDMAELRSAAIEFANCLRQYAEQVTAGEIAFYVVRGDEPAVVSIKPKIGGRHVIHDMKGVSNSTLSSHTRTRIETIFALNGIAKAHEERVRDMGEECVSRLREVCVDFDQEIDGVCQAFLETAIRGSES